MRTSILLITLAVVGPVACAAATSDLPDDATGSTEEALPINMATGDSCDINLPNGTKEPGTRNANGDCCSVFKTDKCQLSDGGIVNPIRVRPGTGKLPSSGVLTR